MTRKNLDNSIDAIKARFLSQPRKWLADRIWAGSFTEDNFETALALAEENTAPDNLTLFTAEKEKLLDGLRRGHTLDAPDLSLPTVQYIWGAAFAYIALGMGGNQMPDKYKGKDISGYALWYDAKNSPDMKQSLRRAAYFLSRSPVNKSVRINYGMAPEGYPGIGFSYEFKRNYCNLDLLWTLVMGVEHSVTVALHEIGHSQLSAQHSPNMRIMYEELRQLEEKSKQGRISEQEIIRLKTLNEEFTLRFYICDEAENSTVNRFAVNQSENLRQDLGASLEYFETVAIDAECETFNSKLRASLGKKYKDLSFEEYFLNLKRAVRMSFHQNNGLFEDYEAEWKKVGFNRQLIKAKGYNDADAFKHLIDLCGQLEKLQLTAEQWEKPGNKEFTVKSQAEARGRIFDEIFDLYVEPQLSKERDKRPEMKIVILEAAPTPQQMREQEKTPSKCKKPGTDPGKSSGQGDEKGEGDGQDNEPGDGKGGSKDDAPLEIGSAEADKKDEKDSAGDEDKTIGDLAKEYNDGGLGEPEEHKNEDEHSHTNVTQLGDITDYRQMVTALEAMIQMAAKAINDLQRRQWEMQGIKEPVGPVSFKKSSQLHILPPSGNLRSINMAANRSLFIKKQQGRATIEDYNRFHELTPQVFTNDRPENKKPAMVDIVVLVDGSNSAYWIEDSKSSDPHSGYRRSLQGEMTPIKAGIATGCVFHEAATRRKVNSYIGLWGQSEIEILAKPGIPQEKIGEGIIGMRHSRNWGTRLSPSLSQIALVIAENNRSDVKMGFSHFFVVSDGDIQDMWEAKELANNLLKLCPLLSIDFGIITKNTVSTMANLAEELQKKYPNRVGSVLISNAERAIEPMVNLINTRVKSMSGVKAVSAAEKSSMLKAGAGSNYAAAALDLIKREKAANEK